MIKEYQNSNEKIIESEADLNELRARNISKKELQSKRNRLTAQLSRDRQKLEVNFLKAMCVNYQRLLRRLEKKQNGKASKPFCQACQSNIENTLSHHRINQIRPAEVDICASDSNMYERRPLISEEEYTQVKRPKF